MDNFSLSIVLAREALVFKIRFATMNSSLLDSRCWFSK